MQLAKLAACYGGCCCSFAVLFVHVNGVEELVLGVSAIAISVNEVEHLLSLGHLFLGELDIISLHVVKVVLSSDLKVIWHTVDGISDLLFLLCGKVWALWLSDSHLDELLGVVLLVVLGLVSQFDELVVVDLDGFNTGEEGDESKKFHLKSVLFFLFPM